MTDLERTLRELGDGLAYPELKSQVEAVLSRLERRRRPRRKWRVLVAVVTAFVALAGTSLAFSQVRTAIFDWFGFAGERIEILDKLPRLEKAENLRLGAGVRVPLQVAQRRLPYPGPLPRLRGLGPPDGVFLRVIGTSRGSIFRLSLLWGKPPAYRLLFSATPRTAVFTRRQSHIVRKRLGADFRIRPYTWTDVNGRRALWISVPHEYLYTSSSHGFAFRVRRARNVLLWQSRRFFFRLEGGLNLDDALRIARSVDI